MADKTRKILYCDMDGVLVDFPSSLPHVAPETLEQYKGREDEIPKIFSLMTPFPGAIEAFSLLSRHFDAYILSTAPWENPTAWTDKLLWVKRYLGDAAHKRLILTHHKNLNRGHFLIDDREKNGADQFAGELILFRKDARFPDWPAVTEYLLTRI